VFEPNGCACTYYNSGQIRLFLDQLGGVELDATGTRKRKWSWQDWQAEHVHAPPIQPITMAINPCIGLRIHSQQQISLTFTCHARSERFQVGANLKVRFLLTIIMIYLGISQTLRIQIPSNMSLEILNLEL
jgi:hypothetical protein